MDTFFKLDHAAAPLENRRLAQWPAFHNVERSREYIAGVEGYFNDHFGFRKRLVDWNNQWKHQLFRETFNDQVLIGRDGWLFFLGDRMLENWRGDSRWSQRDLEAWRRLLEMRRDWLEARGCKYIFVVPPDKHSVYPELLPDWLGKRARPTKVQQLTSYMRAHSTVKVLDLTQALLDAKRIRVAYLKTDTHWNLFGAFAGYREMMKTLAPDFPGLQPLTMDAYRWVPAHIPPGDLPTLLGQRSSFSETEAVKAAPTDSIPKLRLHEDLTRFPPRPSEAREALMAEKLTRYTLNEKATGQVIVFRDSFAGAWTPFLGQHFREVDYVWHYEWDRPLIERDKPVLVIDEMLERFFNIADPVELAKEDIASTNNTCVRASAGILDKKSSSVKTPKVL